MVVASSMVIGWFWQKPVLIAGASGLTILLIVYWAWCHESVLRIFPDRLIASSDLRNTIETSLSNAETVVLLNEDSAWEADPTRWYGLFSLPGLLPSSQKPTVHSYEIEPSENEIYTISWERILRAMDNRNFNILGHATGRSFSGGPATSWISIASFRTRSRIAVSCVVG